MNSRASNQQHFDIITSNTLHQGKTEIGVAYGHPLFAAALG
jgi:hypothetical protein